MTQTLLIELLTEELPPKALNNLGNHFAQSIAEGLEKAQLIDGTTQYTAYASPRRLAVSVANVKPVQADQHVVRKGVSVAAGMKDPVHGLVALHGADVVPVNVLGLDSGRQTLGHRFLSQGAIIFAQADDYAKQIAEQGKVIASFAERRAAIKAALDKVSGSLNARVAADDALLDEVTALVEYPVVLQAEFEAHFLAVPQECLILTMQQNQKYFPLLDQNGKLMNRFLLVSNLQTADPSHIIHGNERVLRARLSDAEFFYKQDQKATLESRLPKLEHVVYHNKIGSQAQRIDRLQTIAAHIAEQLGTDRATAERAARLAKADLVTEMVGEFPELQGTMGKYYAVLDGEQPEIAAAIEQHYQPRFAGDKLPESPIATAVALADKLETLVGIWGIGLIPTGDKDPYALRRAALGVLRMLMNSPLSINDLLTTVAAQFPRDLLAANTVTEVADFMQARLAVLLAAANKRVQNLLKKADAQLGAVQENLLQEDAERALFAATQALRPTVQAALAQHDFQAALTALAAVKPQVDAFFDNVMVMADDAAVKQNRLNLLNELSQLMNAVADISLLGE